MPQATAMALDRLPPFSNEAECGVIGSMLVDPSVIGTVVEMFKQSGENFYDLRHQEIFTTIVELWDERDPVDLISVYERLKTWGKAEQAGGMQYLSSLMDSVASAANVEYYADIVREKYLLRRMIRVCTDTVSQLYDYEGDVAKILDECEKNVLRVNEDRINTSTPAIKQLVANVISQIEAALKVTNGIVGLATGFSDFDKLTRGLRPGTMNTIAARPSLGKTSLALNIADYVAIESRLPVGIISLEMSAASLTSRMIFSRARVNSNSYMDGFNQDRAFPKMTSAAGKVAASPIYIDDTAGQSILQVRAKARRWWQQYGIKLLLIDYLQLMNALGTRKKHDNRQQEVTDISNGVKQLAKELNIPVIVLSQLNREFEREKNRTPRLSDLRESGSIEQDSDLVGFLYKPANDDEDDPLPSQEEAIPVNLLIAKQRDGPTGSVPLTFMKSWTRFESAARVSDEDIPQETQERFI